MPEQSLSGPGRLAHSRSLPVEISGIAVPVQPLSQDFPPDQARPLEPEVAAP